MLLVSSLLIVLGLPLALGKVPQNAWYGFRTERTLQSQAAWDAANRAAGWAFVATGAAVYLAFQASRKAALPTLLAGVAVSAIIGLWKSHSVEAEQTPREIPPSYRRSFFRLSVILSVVFIALGLPLLFAQVPPNGWYGFRTAQSLSSETEWYRANQLTGIYLSAAGAISLWVVLRFREERSVATIPALCGLAACLAAAVHYYW